MKYLNDEFDIDRFRLFSESLELQVRRYAADKRDFHHHRFAEETKRGLRDLLESRQNHSEIGFAEASVFEQIIVCNSTLISEALNGIGGPIQNCTCIHMLALACIESEEMEWGKLGKWGSGFADRLEKLAAMLRIERLQVLAAVGQSVARLAPDTVTVNDVCRMVKRDRTTVEKTRSKWPDPEIKHSGSRAARYTYERLYPILCEEFADAELIPPKQS